MFTLIIFGLTFWIFLLLIKICWGLVCLVFNFFATLFNM